MTMTVAATKEAACKINSDDDDSTGQSFYWLQLDTVVLADKFRELTNRWKQETRYLSSATRISEHASYQAIIALGIPVIPLILEDLQAAPDHSFIALRKITGANPVLTEDVGKVTKMQDAWIRWGMEEGYI